MKHLLFITAISILTLKAQAQNVGIGTTNPGAKLHVSAGDASVALFGPNTYYGAKLYVGASPNNQSAVLTAQVMASDGNLHIDPATGKNIYLGYFQARDIYLNPNGGNVGIGTSTAAFPLSFSPALGDKISLWSTSTNSYGFGIQGSLLQIHTDISAADIAFGYGSSAAFTETMRIKGNGNVGIGNSNPAYQLDISNRMRIRSGGNNSTSAGLWLNNNANTEAAFIGMEDDTHVGLYGTGTGWKFAMNTSNGNIKMMGNVGIGTASPAASLEVNGYTKLGSDAPSIKVKKLTGTTAATGGGYVVIPHGLDHSKILSFAVMVQTNTGFYYYEPNVPGLGVNFYWRATETGLIGIGIISGDSGNIQSAPIKILITYEE